MSRRSLIEELLERRAVLADQQQWFEEKAKSLDGLLGVNMLGETTMEAVSLTLKSALEAIDDELMTP
jgi:hypothetical protein